MLNVLGLLLAVMSPKAQARAEAEVVLCTEAGSNKGGNAGRRGTLIAHVIDNRIYAVERVFGERRSRAAIMLEVLMAKNQWGHNCKLDPKKHTGWMIDLARRLVQAQMHFSGPPAWLTRDVLWVVADSESKKLGATWGKTKCLVHTELGLAFYKKCEP